MSATPTPVEVRRTGSHEFLGTNPRGAEVRVGRSGAEGSFSPGELLLVAAASCAGLTAEGLLTRRLGEDAPQVIVADRDKESEDAHEFSEVRVGYQVDLAAVDPSQHAALKEAVDRAIERLCTVSRTLERGAKVTLDFPGGD